MESSPMIPETGHIYLENETLKAIFSKETGALIRLTSKQTGWNVQERNALGLSFRMLVPLPDRRNNQVLGEKQALADHHLDSDSGRLTLTWAELQSEHGGVLGITFKGSVSISDDGLRFQADIENLSPYVVEAVSLAVSRRYICASKVLQADSDEPRCAWRYGSKTTAPHVSNGPWIFRH